MKENNNCRDVKRNSDKGSITQPLLIDQIKKRKFTQFIDKLLNHKCLPIRLLWRRGNYTNKNNSIEICCAKCKNVITKYPNNSISRKLAKQNKITDLKLNIIE